MGWEDRSWLCSPTPPELAVGPTCPLISFIGIWGLGGVFALRQTDAEAGGGGRGGVFVRIEFEQRESRSPISGGLFSIPGDGGRERCSPQIHDGLRRPCLAGMLCVP